MKKKSVFLGVISSILAAGIILIIVGILLGGSITMYSIELEGDERPQKSVSHELKNKASIQNLDLQLNANDVTLVSGDTFRIIGGTLSENEVRNGTWTVRTNFIKRFSRITVFGVKIPIPKTFWRTAANQEDITIEVPADVKLNKITLNMNAADVDFDTICCNDFNLSLGAGDISIENLVADTAVLDVSAGSVEIDGFQISNSAKVDCKAGDFTFGEDTPLRESYCNNLQADCKMGNFDIAGKLTGTNRINCTMGDISLKLYGVEKNYEIVRSNHALGNIHSKTKGTISDSRLFGSLNLNCKMGDIDILYCGEEN